MKKKPLKGYHLGPYSSTIKVLHDQSFRIDNAAKSKVAKAAGRRHMASDTNKAYIRQLGVAKIQHPGIGKDDPEPMFVIYAHSQITDDPLYTKGPAVVMVVNRDELEALLTMEFAALSV